MLLLYSKVTQTSCLDLLYLPKLNRTKPLGMQASIFGACPKPGYIGRVSAGRASGAKMGDVGGGSLISPDVVMPSQIVGVSASDISPCTMKSRRRFLVAPARKKVSSGTGSPG